MRVMSPERLRAADSAITRVDGSSRSRVAASQVRDRFLWLGILKFFPNVSPAEELATGTINVLGTG